MIDPLEFAKKMERTVCEGNGRMYYRFRRTRFYGGCATADCVGCNLRCAYCWSQQQVWNPKKSYKFYSPEMVADELVRLRQSVLRISGGEPTLCKDHLLKVLERIPNSLLFILETNGILLDKEYIKELRRFKNLHVRVSLKGVDPSSFEQITGASGDYFHRQLDSLRLLKEAGISHGAALIFELFSSEQIEHLGIADLENESLIKYPFVVSSLKKRGI